MDDWLTFVSNESIPICFTGGLMTFLIRCAIPFSSSEHLTRLNLGAILIPIGGTKTLKEVWTALINLSMRVHMVSDLVLSPLPNP